MTEYPHDRSDMMTFEEVTRYPVHSSASGGSSGSGGGVAATAEGQSVAVVTYGNGVVTALEALAGMPAEEAAGVVVIDSPYLSAVPKQLREAVAEFDVVLFAEICKDGPGAPLLSHACALHNEGALPQSWYATCHIDMMLPGCPPLLLACALTTCCVWNSLLLYLPLARWHWHAQGHRGRGACVQPTRLDDYVPEWR
eukprot:COSAG06_NODE_15410_length_1072_cov_3.034943_2_plen_197_part_00